MTKTASSRFKLKLKEKELQLLKQNLGQNLYLNLRRAPNSALTKKNATVQLIQYFNADRTLKKPIDSDQN